MTTQLIKLCYRNILETGNVSVTDQNNSYPSYRLYDRDLGKLFKGNSAGNNNTFNVYVDQGANNSYEVDRLVIPAGHSLNGLPLSLQYSADNNNYSNAMNGWNGTASAIDQSFNAQNSRFWKFTITTANNVPELPELYLTKAYQFERNPNYGLEAGKRKNILADETQAGIARFVKLGEPKRYRNYELTKIGNNQRSSLQSWDDHCEGIKTIYLVDHEGEAFFAWLFTKDLIFTMEHEGRWGTHMQFLEVI